MGNTSSHFTRNLSNATVFICLLVTIATIAQAQVKLSKPDFDTGKGPVSVAAADFNRDGLLDVVTANSGDNTISVLLNNGNDTFGRRTDYATGAHPAVVVAADFNNDGAPDVAVANQDDKTISIFVNNGDGTLKLLSTFAVGFKPTVLIAADFNKDGNIDLAVNSGGNFSIFLGSGNGNFTHNADYSSENGGFGLATGWLVAADFNGDGILDLASTSGRLDNVSIFLGNGDGTFRNGSSFTLFGGASPIGDGRMLAADFNQDGKADLLVEFHDCRQRGCESGTVVFAGHGDGTFDGGHPFPITGFDDPIITADLNADHVPDVITPGIAVVVNPATVFTTAIHSSFTFGAGLGPASTVAGDFNRDGKADLVVTNFEDNTVSLLQGNGDGTFHQLQRYQFPVVNTGPDGIATADFNRDGVGDIVVKSTQSQGIWLYLGNGDGTLRPPVQLSADLQPFAMLVADVNHDGLPDIVLNGEVFVNHQFQGDVVRVLLSNGDGTFRSPIDSPSPFLANFQGAMAVGDFNGDGTVDIVIRSLVPTTPLFTNTLAVFFGNGDGSFRSPVQTQIPGETSGLVVGDFNRDGKLDVITSRNDGNNQLGINVYLGNGDGTFRAGSTFGAGVPALTADLNHDGLLDLLVSQGNSIGVFFGNGDGTFRHQSDLPVGGGGMQLADINGDGNPDLVVSSGQIFILLGNGDGSFQQPQGFPVGGAGPAAITDLNRDGAPDIAVATSSTFPLQSSVSLLLSGNGPPPARDFHLNLSATSATVKAGQSATATATIVAIGTFADSVTFSCTGLPPGAACSFNLAGVTPGANGQATSTLTITTQAHTSSALVPFWNGRIGVALGLPVVGIVLAGIRIRRRPHLAFLLVFLLVVLMLQGCGGLGSGSSGGGSGGGNGGGGGTGGGGTPTGTFTVVITGASGGSPVVTHSQNFTLTVQ